MRPTFAVLLLLVAADAPERFAPDTISVRTSDELNASFTPDGRSVYFTRTIAGGSVGRVGRIMKTTRMPNGSWSVPGVQTFSGTYADFDPFVAPDGRRVFFISNRPLTGDSAKKTFDIWYADRTARGWSDARPVDAVNGPGHELFPSPVADGTLYFSSCGRADSRGGCDLYRSRFRNGRYQPPEALSDSVNSAADETDTFVAPDQSYMVLTSSGRADSTGRSDLYVSRALPGGGWSVPRKLGPEINTGAREYCPIVFGEYLYFTRQPSDGLGDVYRVPVSVLR